MRIVFWAGAVTVGLLVTGFAELAEIANGLFERIAGQWPYAVLIICPAGLVLVNLATRRVFPGAEGSGIPQAIAALGMSEHVARNLILSLRIALGKILLTIVGLLSGASIGREGPSVHVGAAVMFSLGGLAKFPHHYMDRGLILAGGAAGIAAAFNTPLAGILFAIEEMGRSFEERTSGTLITAVFLAGITAVAIQGNYVYFGSSTAFLNIDQVLVPILACGVTGGLLGGLFSHSLIWGSRKLAPVMRKRPLQVAAGCGLGIAVIGLVSGGSTFGTGYTEAQSMVTGTGEASTGFPILKMLATGISYLSGIPGGIFSPSLSAGAGIGAELATWMPASPPGAIVILGMAAYFTGVVQTPITAFVIVMEMTDNSQLLLPLMATTLIAYATSRLICPQAIYAALAENYLSRTPAPQAPETTEQQRS